MREKIVVLGAGVIGLTTALLLARDKDSDVTVLAEFHCGDYDIRFASPWAGADYLPVSLPDTPLNKYERETWVELERLAKTTPGAGCHFLTSIKYRREKESASSAASWQAASMAERPWYMDMMPDARHLEKHELPAGMKSGVSFTSICINTAIYLPWLASQCLKYGVKFKRGVVNHVSEAADLHISGSRAALVVNATGLGARTLGGVEDLEVIPARGQITIVRNEPGVIVGVGPSLEGPADESCYIMQRAAGGGTVIGGCYQLGSWESQPDPSMAVRIMARAVELCPSLTAPGNGGVPGKTGIEALSIIRHGVGLRPTRAAGPRVEFELIQDLPVVHAYGHGGVGYQSSWGSCNEAVRLVEAALSKT